jgi:uncharacterized protein YxeA
MKKYLIILIFILGCLIFPKQSFAAFSYYRSITVNSAQVPSTQTNFPMLVSGTYSYLAQTPTGKVQNANGYDVGFYTKI